MRNLLTFSVVIMFLTAVSGCGCSSQRELLQMEQDRIALECKLEKLKAQREECRQIAEGKRMEWERQVSQKQEWEEVLRNTSRKRKEKIAKLEEDAPNMVAESEAYLDTQNRKLKTAVLQRQVMQEKVRDFVVKHHPTLWQELEELRARVTVLVTRSEEIAQESARLEVRSEACQDVIRRRDEAIRELRGKEMLIEQMYIEEKTRGL